MISQEYEILILFCLTSALEISEKMEGSFPFDVFINPDTIVLIQIDQPLEKHYSGGWHLLQGVYPAFLASFNVIGILLLLKQEQLEQ